MTRGGAGGPPPGFAHMPHNRSQVPENQPQANSVVAHPSGLACLPPGTSSDRGREAVVGFPSPGLSLPISKAGAWLEPPRFINCAEHQL